MSRRMFRDPAAEAESQVLSPPKNLLESSHRRSISSSTCSKEKLSRSNGGDVAGVGPGMKEGEIGPLNSFLREQRVRIERISRGEMSGKAKIILSGSDYNSYGLFLLSFINGYNFSMGICGVHFVLFLFGPFIMLV